LNEGTQNHVHFPMNGASGGTGPADFGFGETAVSEIGAGRVTLLDAVAPLRYFAPQNE